METHNECLRWNDSQGEYSLDEIIRYIRGCFFEFGLPTEMQFSNYAQEPMMYYFPSGFTNMECVIKRAVQKFGIPYNVAIHSVKENGTKNVTLNIIFR